MGKGRMITAGLLAALTLGAGASDRASGESLWAMEPLSDQELAGLRGGFTLDNLEIAIGLEQIVSVDGETLILNRLNIPNLNQNLNGQGLTHSLETVLANASPGQSGLSFVSGTAGSGGWMTMIQNSLNGTVIQNLRQLDIELNNLGSAYRMPREMSEPFFPGAGR